MEAAAQTLDLAITDVEGLLTGPRGRGVIERARVQI
jgi:hypothetical protein